MRSIIAGVSLGVVLLAVGCNVLLPHRPPVGPGPGPADLGTPKVENLVQYLNRQAELIGPDDALKCTNLSIDCKAGHQTVGLGGMMICQKPRSFRLQAQVIGQPAVDIGSNNEEFWYWISKNEPPYLFHCSYEALGRGANVPFPFQPDMVVTALGIASYDPNKKYELNAPQGRSYFELIERTTSPQGQPIQKVVVFNRGQVTPPAPQVIAYALRDDKGNPICVANIKSVQQNRETGAILPKVVSFNWPSQKLSMTMDMNNLQVVKMNNETAGRFFSRRNLNYQAYDLASRTLEGSPLQRAGATAPIGGMR
jgi:hypothetical protein